MTDEEFVFRETSRERKRNGIGTFSKKRRGGKYVRLPSDHMSKKEKMKMNGEVKVYNFSKPMSWERFKGAPDDIKQQYIDTLLEKFNGVTGSLIAESMGTKKELFGAYISKHGVTLRRGVGGRGNSKQFLETEDGAAWKKWVSGASVKEPQKEDVEVEECYPMPESKLIPCEVQSEVKQVGDIGKIAELLSGLVGTGAKVTIEFVL